MSEASYSRLQILLDEREHKFNGSPILEHTSGVSVSPFLHSNDVNTSTPSISLSNDKMEDQQQVINKKDRHIHFNMRVDQCIALDSEFHDYNDHETNTKDEQHTSEDDDDEEDECSTDYEYQSESDDAQNDTSKSIVSSSYHDDGEFTLPDHVVNVAPQRQQHHHHHTNEIDAVNDEEYYDDDDDDGDDDDDDDGFMINPSGNKNISHVPHIY
ncbi:unnamed protein product [[Candida] boidinii]|nr:unnamed protein product [[Candida] boidinii]